MTIRGVVNPQSLKDYLGSKDLTEHLRLTKELSFHWANWDQTCLAQRRHYKNFNSSKVLISGITARTIELKSIKDKNVVEYLEIASFNSESIFRLSRKYVPKDHELAMTIHKIILKKIKS